MKSIVLRLLILIGSLLPLSHLSKMLCKTILLWHRFEITFVTEETLKEVRTWNKGKIYTVSLFLAQLFFWFSPFKKRVFCQPHCEHWQEWPKQILFAMILILMTQDYWTWVVVQTSVGNDYLDDMWKLGGGYFEFVEIDD